MRIRIDGYDLPGYRGIRVGVQRRDRPTEWLDPQPGDAATVVWNLDCRDATVTDGVLDVRGPYIQGGPGRRFIYLSWSEPDEAGRFTMFRRAKLWLDGVEPDTARAAVATGRLTARLGLTDAQGQPLCAAVRPPKVTWSAA